jgi:hypothetical protein
MALLTIPVGHRIAAQTQITTLDGRRYRLSLDWLQRIARWTFSLETEAGDAICSTKGLATRGDLLRLFRWNPACPPGVLTVIDTLAGGDSEPELDTLGRRHALIYFEAGEDANTDAASSAADAPA